MCCTNEYSDYLNVFKHMENALKDAFFLLMFTFRQNIFIITYV